jgi:hypothetical protein
MARENKGVIGEGILWKTPPPPMFCVSAGMIGLTRAVASGVWLVASNRIADKGVGRVVCVPDEAEARVEVAQEQRTRSMTPPA